MCIYTYIHIPKAQWLPTYKLQSNMDYFLETFNHMLISCVLRSSVCISVTWDSILYLFPKVCGQCCLRIVGFYLLTIQQIVEPSPIFLLLLLLLQTPNYRVTIENKLQYLKKLIYQKVQHKDIKSHCHSLLP